MIKEFYGVTYDSEAVNTITWQVKLTGEHGNYYLEASSHLDDNWQDAEDDNLFLKNGAVLGIMSRHHGLVRYNPMSREERPDHKAHVWGDKTSPLVALFLFKHEASKCFSMPDLKYWDKRFINDSMAVIKHIANMETFTSLIRLDQGLKDACDKYSDTELRKYLQSIT